MTNLTRIVAIVIDTKKAVLYKHDGTTVELLQGDERLRPIVEHATPLLSSQGWAEVDLQLNNDWKDFEEKTNGAVRLFRIAKSKLANLFGRKTEPLQEGSIGQVPNQQEGTAGDAKVSMAQAAVAEIMKHATPVTANDFDEKKVAAQRPTAAQPGQYTDLTDKITTDGHDPYFDKHEDTIVAVTPKGAVIPGVERIKSQFAAVAKTGDAKGLTLFLERLGAVAQQRKHTPEELLRFMERGDLPIADDGTIIVYKRLWRQGDVFVDPHSKRVLQRVGSYVHMDASMVDDNRRTECSNGLHVARRSYIGSFAGDVVCLAKVRPEDVISVPNYDASKMRVCGYHLIAELTKEQYHAIIHNRPISDAPGGEELLNKAIAGDHIGINQMVKIQGQSGTNLHITDVFADGEEALAAEQQEALAAAKAVTPVEGEKAEPSNVMKKVKTVSKKARKAKRKMAAKKAVAAAKKASTLEAVSTHPSACPVDVKAVQKLKEGDKTALKLEVPAPVTQTDVVKALWDDALAGKAGKAQELLDFKKKAKKGWAVWGLPENAGETLKALLN